MTKSETATTVPILNTQNSMKLIISSVLLCLVAGCATPQLAPVKETTQRFDQPFDKVWGSIVASVTSDYPIQVIEKQSGVLETQFVSLPGNNPLKQYGVEPSIFLSIWYQNRARLSVYAKAQGETNTTVRVAAHFEGFEGNMTKNWYVWPSNGVLEQQIIERISSNLH
jgi:hypothetical protein